MERYERDISKIKIFKKRALFIPIASDVWDKEKN